MYEVQNLIQSHQFFLLTFVYIFFVDVIVFLCLYFILKKYDNIDNKNIQTQPQFLDLELSLTLCFPFQLCPTRLIK